MLQFLEIFGYLLAGHALCDYALQTDFIAQNKCPNNTKQIVPWFYVMSAHCLIHAGAVALITGYGAFACVEFVTHFHLDITKCENKINIHEDQLAHIFCKLMYAASFLFI